jgi:membrane protein required for colicin V production
MQPYDILMVVVLVGAALFGFWKGMAWQIAAVASVVLSAVAAIYFGARLAPLFGQHDPWNRFAAMLAIYLATALAIWLIFRLVAGAIDRVKLKEFDRQIGALFGLAKGILWCIIITFFVVTLSESARQKVLGSQSGRYIALLIKNATPVLPKEVTSVLGKYIEELDRKLDPNTPPEPSGDALPALGGDGLKNWGQGVIGEVKKGLDAQGTQLQQGLQQGVDTQFDSLRKRLKDTTSAAGAKAQSGIDNLQERGKSLLDEAGGSQQGRGGSGWWK